MSLVGLRAVFSSLEERVALAGCGKSDFVTHNVIPAKAGIQSFQDILDSRFVRK